MPSSLGSEARAVMRLSSRGHWDVPVHLPDGTVLNLLASHPTPPVFDRTGRNRARNRDEIRFWALFLDGALPWDVSDPFILLGDLNADPYDGEGGRGAIRALLNHPRLVDPLPRSAGGVSATERQKGTNEGQRGDPALDTADWDATRKPGNLRVDYVLPSADLKVTGAGVFWPAPGEDGFELVGPDGTTGSHHRLVWVDIDIHR